MEMQSVNLLRGNLMHITQADSKVAISHHDCSPWHENSSTLDSGIDVPPGINVAPPFKNIHINFNAFLHQSRHCGHF